MQIEPVDFVSFLTQDIQRAKRFYAETLGLELEEEGEGYMEFEPARSRSTSPTRRASAGTSHRRFDA